MEKDDIEQTNTPVIAMLRVIEHLIKLDRFYFNAMNEHLFLDNSSSDLVLRIGDSLETATTIVVICRSLLEHYLVFLLQKNENDFSKKNICLNDIENTNLKKFCFEQNELRVSLVHGVNEKINKINKFSLDDYNGIISDIMSEILKETEHKDESYSNQLIYCTFELIKYLGNKYPIKDNEKKSKQNKLIMERIDTLEKNNLGAILFPKSFTHSH